VITFQNKLNKGKGFQKDDKENKGNSRLFSCSAERALIKAWFPSKGTANYSFQKLEHFGLREH